MRDLQALKSPQAFADNGVMKANEHMCLGIAPALDEGSGAFHVGDQNHDRRWGPACADRSVTRCCGLRLIWGACLSDKWLLVSVRGGRCHAVDATFVHDVA